MNPVGWRNVTQEPWPVQHLEGRRIEETTGGCGGVDFPTVLRNNPPQIGSCFVQQRIAREITTVSLVGDICLESVEHIRSRYQKFTNGNVPV